MSNSTPATATEAGAAAAIGSATVARIGDFLGPRRTVIDLEVGSRKRLFEQLARLVAAAAADGPALDDILATLIKREKLGCTGLGRGIALPHGRLAGIEAPVIAAARLKNAIDYDAPDGEAVWLAVCLLVPVEATSTHLNILAALAGGFSRPDFCAQLQTCATAAALAALLGDIEVAS